MMRIKRRNVTVENTRHVNTPPRFRTAFALLTTHFPHTVEQLRTVGAAVQWCCVVASTRTVGRGTGAVQAWTCAARRMFRLECAASSAHYEANEHQYEHARCLTGRAHPHCRYGGARRENPSSSSRVMGAAGLALCPPPPLHAVPSVQAPAPLPQL